jgi:hypothetical protein
LLINSKRDAGKNFSSSEKGRGVLVEYNKKSTGISCADRLKVPEYGWPVK